MKCSCNNKKKKKLNAVSNPVWVYLKAVIQKKTFKEECTNENYSNDNYNYYGEGCIKTLRSTT